MCDLSGSGDLFVIGVLCDVADSIIEGCCHCDGTKADLEKRAD